MNRRWPDEATQFAESVTVALGRLGAVEFARRAEADPSLRRSELAPVFERLGFADIDVLGSASDALAAAAAARAAGAVVAPWPVAAQLAAPRGPEAPAAIYPSLGEPTRLPHLDLFGGAVAIDVRDGSSRSVAATGGVVPMPLDPFGVECAAADSGPGIGDEATRARALDAQLVLTAYYVLGALEKAVELAATYARERRQFGEPIAQFGAIQWRLSDIVVARDGLNEIAGDTLWRFCDESATPADTLGLRLAMLEAAQTVLANAHQVFGSIGLCEEHDLAVIDRHLQHLLRRPGGATATGRLLGERIAAYGYDAIFPIEPTAALHEAR